MRGGLGEASPPPVINKVIVENYLLLNSAIITIYSFTFFLLAASLDMVYIALVKPMVISLARL